MESITIIYSSEKLCYVCHKKRKQAKKDRHCERAKAKRGNLMNLVVNKQVVVVIRNYYKTSVKFLKKIAIT